MKTLHVLNKKVNSMKGKFLLIVSLVLALSACGGGKDKKDPVPPKEPTEPTLSITSSEASASLDEGDSFTFSLTQNNDEDVSFTLSSNGIDVSDYLTYAIETQGKVHTVVMTIKELSTQAELKLDIKGKGNKTTAQSVYMDLTLNNESAHQKLFLINELQSLAENTMKAPEEKELISRLGKLAVMTGRLTSKELDGVKYSFSDLTTDEHIKTSRDLFASEVKASLTIYDDESDIDEALRLVKLNYSNYFTPINKLIILLQDSLGSDLLPVKALGSIYYSQQQDSGKVSQFVGNELLGGFTAGEWVFAETYGYLKDITFPENTTCQL